MLHGADDVVAALTEGYQLARRSVVRAQESARREFIDDLLTGTPDVGGLLRRAPGFGLDLTGPYAVACVRSDRAVDDASPLLRTLERAIQGSKADAPALLATKYGHLVVVFAAPDAAALSEVLERLGNTLANTRTLGTWQLAVGRPARGADGVVTSYRESRDLLDLAARLGIHDPVLSGHDLAVYRILLRDREMLTDLVDSTIGPLRTARGGAEPLVDTLLAYYASGGVAARAARDLHLSVRAVTYRLDRVRSLTGLDPDGTTDRLTLHVAALGARLLTGRTALS
jgi:sugar diacid utilization regulator